MPHRMTIQRKRTTLLERRLMTGLADRDLKHRVFESGRVIRGEAFNVKRRVLMLNTVFVRETADV